MLSKYGVVFLLLIYRYNFDPNKIMLKYYCLKIIQIKSLEKLEKEVCIQGVIKMKLAHVQGMLFYSAKYKESRKNENVNGVFNWSANANKATSVYNPKSTDRLTVDKRKFKKYDGWYRTRTNKSRIQKKYFYHTKKLCSKRLVANIVAIRHCAEVSHALYEDLVSLTKSYWVVEVNWHLLGDGDHYTTKKHSLNHDDGG